MDINFKNKVIVVTGAGKGIGRDICKRLYEHGATVYAISRSTDLLTELKTELPNIKTISVNLANWKETVDALQIIVKGSDRIDGLVNNAGIAIIKPFLELTEQDFDDTFDVNVKAIFNVTQQLIPKMGSGSSIVNVSSLAGFIGIDGHSAYTATKAAVDGLTKSLALEFGSKNIRVNSVNPTVVLTKMGRENWSDPAKSEPLLNSIPLHRFAQVQEVVDAVVYLLSDRSSFVNGHQLPIEGGYLAC